MHGCASLRCTHLHVHTLRIVLAHTCSGSEAGCHSTSTCMRACAPALPPLHAQAMRGWLPKGTPLSPSRKAKGLKALAKTTTPRKGATRTDDSARDDVVGGVNQQAVGEVNTSVGGLGSRKDADSVPSSSHPSSSS